MNESTIHFTGIKHKNKNYFKNSMWVQKIICIFHICKPIMKSNKREKEINKPREG